MIMLTDELLEQPIEYIDGIFLHISTRLEAVLDEHIDLDKAEHRPRLAHLELDLDNQELNKRTKLRQDTLNTFCKTEFYFFEQDGYPREYKSEAETGRAIDIIKTRTRDELLPPYKELFVQHKLKDEQPWVGGPYSPLYFMSLVPRQLIYDDSSPDDPILYTLPNWFLRGMWSEREYYVGSIYKVTYPLYVPSEL